MSTDKKSVHEGHRQRLKDRYLRSGLDHFEEHQVLELLLFYCIPRRDTNALAHDLIDRFGSLSRVLDAPVEDLTAVPGISANAATLLKLVTDLGRYYRINCAMREKILNTVEDCGWYLTSFFHGLQNETVFLLCMDAKCKVLACEKVSEGGINSAAVPVRQIVETALRNNATVAVLAHNHPSGVAVPSREDILTTRRVAAALDTVDVQLTDHIIVADDDWVSLAQSNLYRYEDCRMEV